MDAGSPRSSLFPGSPPQNHNLPLYLAEVDEEQDGHSVISSRVTDVGDGSERGEAVVRDSLPGAKSQRNSLQPPIGRPARISVGDHPSDAFSRPSTAASSSAKPWSNPPPSRRGLTPSIRARPTSSASRTHVPSLTSHAFYRPMSSAKLQQQRSKLREDTDVESRLRLSTPVFGNDLNDDIYGTQSGIDANRRDTFSDADGNMGGYNPYARASGSPTAGTTKSQSSELPLHTPEDEHEPGQSRGSDHASAMNKKEMGSGNISNSNGGKKGPKVRREKNYEHFPGNTNFCFWGRLQTTNDVPMNILTGILLVVPSALFFAYSSEWLWYNVSPALPITAGYLFLVCFSSFLKASFSDPGIYPRNLHPLEGDDPDNLLSVPPENTWARIKPPSRTVQPVEIPVKYCRTCRIWRPPRCHHCRACDNCVETQDHHCVWLNNCVGRRNYRYFFTFITTLAMLAVYILILSITHMKLWARDHGKSFSDSIDDLRVPFAVLVFAAVSTLYPVALTCYHIFLMARGETTREHLVANKFLQQDRHRAFDQLNWFKNFVNVLCRPRPPTYVQLKNDFEPGDQRFETFNRPEPPPTASTGSQIFSDEGGVGADGTHPVHAAEGEGRVETIERTVLSS